MIKQKYFKLLSMLLLMCCAPVAILSAATPVDGDTFLFIGSGNTADYASDFASLVNNDPSLGGITITAEGYSSSSVTDDYYRDRHTQTKAGVPIEVDNAFTTKLGEDFDYIIILGSSGNLQTYPALFLESVYLIKDWIRWQNKSSKIVLAGVWNSEDSATRQTMNEKLYRIGDAMETEVAPANLAWDDIINDSSISISHTALSSHTAETRYTLAASLFAHYFERLTANTTFTLSGLTAQEMATIDTHAFNNWVFGQNLVQYSGEFTDSYYTAGQFPSGSSGHALSAVGFMTSTENAVVDTMGKTNVNTKVRSWVSTSDTAILGGTNWDVMFVRWNAASYSGPHNTWIANNKNPNVNFVGYLRHSGQVSDLPSSYPNNDLMNIDYTHTKKAFYNGVVRSQMNDDNYGWSIPMREGFGRFVEQRLKSAPYANDADVYWGTHLGRYYEGWMGNMLYIISTGNKPAYKPTGWARTTTDNDGTVVSVNAADWNFGIDKTYEIMMHYGSLKGANGETIPVRENYAPLLLSQSLNVDQNTVSNVIIPLVATDKDSAALSFSIVDPPVHGNVSINGAIVTYTPDSSYNSGSDDFTVQANDGSIDSNIATVSIIVGDFSPVPEINVLGNGLGILDSSISSSLVNHTVFPEIIVQLGVGSTRTFSILNSGLSDLDLSGVITVTGADAADFTITQQPAVDPLSSNLSTDFVVTFLATSGGAKNAIIHVPSNDSDEADFDFAVSGVANAIELEYANTSFAEAVVDDGSIDNTPIVINIQNETFSGANGRDLVADGDVTISNLPAGLTATVVKVSDTQLSATLSGSATYHEASQSVESLTFSFPDSAFSTYSSAGIVNSSRSDLQIIFAGDIPYVGNANDSGAGSLRRVVADAADGSIVRFLPFVTGVNLTTDPVFIDKDLVIDGAGAVTIDGGSMISHFQMVGSSTAVTLKDITLTNGRNTISGFGGSLYSVADLTLINCVLSNNTSDYDGINQGGAIYSRGNLTVNNSVFINNECTQLPTSSVKRDSFGGAINQEGYTLTINDSEFENNKAIATSYLFATTGLGRGGALYLSNVVGSVITNTQFKDNVATSIGSTNTGDTSGGAIYSECKTGDGDLTIDKSLFVGNSAATAGNSYGGALSFVADERNSTVTITNTTIYSNDTGGNSNGKRSEGGAIFIDLVDVDPLLPTATVSIYNSTVAENTSVATLTANALGGGICLHSGSMSIDSTLIGDNSAGGSGQDLMLQSAGTLTVSYSLIESTDGNHGLTDGIDGNVVGSDALLGTLADRGGLTQTVELLAGSPAVNTGSNPLGLTTDQRGVGFDRLLETQTDMGSYESIIILPPGTMQFSSSAPSISEDGNSVSITVDRLDASNGAISVDYATSDGSATASSDYTAISGTLNWADGDMTSKSFTIIINDDSVYEGDETLNITLSNANPALITGINPSVLTITENEAFIIVVVNSNDSGVGSLRQIIADASPSDTVQFDPSVTSISLNSPITIDKNLSIDGMGAVTLDAGNTTTHFLINDSTATELDVNLSGLTLTNGENSIDGLGGAIHSQESLTLTDCILNDNQSVYNGANRGGAVYSRGDLTINGCVFTNNECTQTPGTAIKRNSLGGAIDQEGYTLIINDSEFENNKAIATSYEFATTGLGYGGALYLSNVVGSVITNTQFKDNVATSIGSTKTGDTSGGAIYSECKTGDGDLTIDKSLFVGNSAATAGNSYGGALSFVADERNSTVTITNTTIHNNDTGASRTGKRSEGGAIFVDLVDVDPLNPTATVSIYNSTVAGNTAVAATTANALGGGLALDSGSLDLVSVIISDNSAQGVGQDLMLQSAGTLLVSHSLIESTEGNHGLLDGVDGNIVGQDALLGSLADNGGPTQTIELLAGSPALDAGSNSLSLTTDQRGTGYSRSFGVGVDIGAFELSAETFVTWATESGLTGGDAAIDADPDGDGVVNLLEYFVGSDPLSAGAIKISSAIDGNDKLSISYESDNATEPTDVIVTVQGSSDLGITDPWAPVAATHSVNGAGPYTHIWTQDLAVGSANQAFIRIVLSE